MVNQQLQNNEALSNEARIFVRKQKECLQILMTLFAHQQKSQIFLSGHFIVRFSHFTAQ